MGQLQAPGDGLLIIVILVPRDLHVEDAYVLMLENNIILYRVIIVQLTTFIKVKCLACFHFHCKYCYNQAK